MPRLSARAGLSAATWSRTLKVAAEELVGLEERLARGEVRCEDIPLLLALVRHVLDCRCRRDAAKASSERRRKRENKSGKPRGHGRNGAKDFPGAQRVPCPHVSLKEGDPSPCCGKKLYRSETAVKIELKGVAAPISGTIFELEVLRCPSCQDTYTAPLPPEATGKKYDPSVDATISLARYEMGVPHHRLAQLQDWAGVPLAPSTQWERVEVMAKGLYPVFQRLQTSAANEALVHTDDTGARIIELQKENATRGPKERTGIFTTGMVAKDPAGKNPTVVLYASGRLHEGENMDKLMEKRSPDAEDVIHLSDGTSRKPTFKRRIPGSCLTHARRYFIKAYSAFPEQCDHVLDELALVYRNDRATTGMDPQARLRHHQEHSGPVMKRLKDWIEEQTKQRLVEPNSRLGRAFRYVVKRWTSLVKFLEVPGVPLDNNPVERELKPAQRHRKNSLFYQTVHGAAVGDIIMSMTRTCAANDADTFHYLTAVGTHAKRVRAAPQEWLPWTYRQTLAAIA